MIYQSYLGGLNETIDKSYLCKSGYYCKVDSQLFSCPKGFYCPSGSSRPYPCTFGLMACPNDRTAKVNAYAGIFKHVFIINSNIFIQHIYTYMYIDMFICLVSF